MTTYIHGKSSAFLHGAYDLSPWLNDANANQSLQTADTSHFGADAKTYIVGQNDGTISFAGLYDGTVGAIEPIMAAVIASESSTPVTYAPEGIGIGKSAIMGLAKQTSYKVDQVVSDVVKVSGDVQVTEGVHSGYLLNTLTAFGATAGFTGVDNAAATTLGGVAYLHVPTNLNTGSLTAKIQHSTDNAVWVDHTSFTVIPTITTGSEAITLAGTINRYVRLYVTLAGTGNVTATASVARN